MKKYFIITAIFTLFIAALGSGKMILAQEQAIQENSTTPNNTVTPEDFLPTETAQNTQPEQETMRGTVTTILDEGTDDVYGQPQQFQTLKVRVTKGSLKDQEVEVLHGVLPEAGSPSYVVGDKVFVLKVTAPDGIDVFYITDSVRINILLVLLAVFAFFVILVARWWGVNTLVGIGYSLVIIFVYLLPRLGAGSNPVITSIISAFMIAPVTFYLSHGFNKKTTTALIGTLSSILLTGILAAIFVTLAKITGYGSEDAMFLQLATGASVNVKGLLLAGIILGSLGLLNDAAVTQVSKVYDLRMANKKMDATKIFQKAMDENHTHTASLVNSLLLLYIGVSMPLLALFLNNPITTLELINTEIVAEEIVRALVGGIGVVLAIPITTLIASLTNYNAKNQVKPK